MWAFRQKLWKILMLARMGNFIVLEWSDAPTVEPQSSQPSFSSTSIIWTPLNSISTLVRFHRGWGQLAFVSEAISDRCFCRLEWKNWLSSELALWLTWYDLWSYLVVTQQGKSKHFNHLDHFAYLASPCRYCSQRFPDNRGYATQAFPCFQCVWENQEGLVDLMM